MICFECVCAIFIAGATVFLMVWYNPHEQVQRMITEMKKGAVIIQEQVYLKRYGAVQPRMQGAHYKISHSWVVPNAGEGSNL